MAKIVIDFTGVESGGGKIRVPEGDYAMTLKTIKQKKGTDSGEPYLLAGFELSKGPKKGNGKILNHNFSLQTQSLWNLRNYLEACGKQVPSKKVSIDPDKLIGLECAGTVIDDEYNNRKQSSISAFFPLDDLGSTGSGDDFEPEEEEEKPSGKGKDKGKNDKKGGKKKEEEEEEDTELGGGGEEDEEELFS